MNEKLGGEVVTDIGKAQGKVKARVSAGMTSGQPQRFDALT